MSTKHVSAKEALEDLVGPFSFAIFMVGCRTTLNLTQVELAKKLKISKQSLWNIESGRTKVSVDTAIKYANLMGFPEETAVEACFYDLLGRHSDRLAVTVDAKKKGTKIRSHAGSNSDSDVDPHHAVA